MSLSRNALLCRLTDAVFHDGPHVADEALDGPSGGVTEGADGVALDLLGDLPQHVDLLHPGVALLHAQHDVVQPGGALAAGGALPAGLVLVKVGEARDGVDGVGALVHHDHRGGAQTRLRLLQRIKVHQHVVTHGLGDHGDGGAAGDDGQQVVPPPAHTPSVLLDQLAQRDGHLLLNRARRVHVPADAEELGARVVGAPKGGEPIGAAAQDGGRHRHRLHVGHGGGAAVEADARGKRRLQPRFPLLPLKRFDQRRFLATDVRTGAPVHVHIKVLPTPARVLAQEALLVGLIHGPHESHALVHKLATDVNVRGARAHGGARDEAALHELVRVVAHDLAVLAGAGLRFVRIDHQVGRPPVAHLWHEAPLQARGEAGAAAATQPRLLHLVNNPVRSHLYQLLGLVPIAALHRTLDANVCLAIQVGEDAVFISQATKAGLGTERACSCGGTEGLRAQGRTRTGQGTCQHCHERGDSSGDV
mmetsp:Transcript_19209/g.34218  ORF Transcript_19209/g.34218 Transcript_19209/m.34218 type:complete len:476 (-) Transcript_19209:63-1490(-)